MALPTSDFISASLYNSLPFINDVKDDPLKFAKDLNDLKNLLRKYKIPDTICVKLIHIHFEVLEDEVMAFKNVDVPPHGEIETLGPHKVTPATKLYGCHHFVNDQGELQAFEYMAEKGPDMSAYSHFVHEFCEAAIDKKLQRTFGLSLKPDDEGQGGWVELEYPWKRMTFNVPIEIKLPDIEWSYYVTTLWSGIIERPTRHCHCVHHRHVGGHRRWDDKSPTLADDLHYGGVQLEVGTPFQRVFSSAIGAY